MTRCNGCSDWRKRWIFTFYLVANANFSVRMISVYLANARATRIKIKIEPSFAQRVSSSKNAWFEYWKLDSWGTWAYLFQVFIQHIEVGFSPWYSIPYITKVSLISEKFEYTSWVEVDRGSWFRIWINSFMYVNWNSATCMNWLWVWGPHISYTLTHAGTSQSSIQSTDESICRSTNQSFDKTTSPWPILQIVMML